VKELREDGSRIVNFYKNENLLRFEELLPIIDTIIDTIGHIPLPPYINREDTKEDANEYQSVFAQEAGAVAAPTASLHFTQEQHERITQNFKHAYVTLHVGSGTFKPVEANLFLHPNNRPSRVNHLLTNFHLPKSTLLMLVASFVGLQKTQELYTEAIKEKYRFYSYGDAMLIL